MSICNARKVLCGVVLVAAATVHASEGEYVFYISNHDQSPVHRVVHPIVGQTNFVYDAKGALEKIRGEAIAFLVRDCENVTIRNARIDWERPCMTEARIVGFENGATTVSIDRKTFPFAMIDGKIAMTGPGWTNGVWLAKLIDGRTKEHLADVGDIPYRGEAELRPGGNVALLHDFSKYGAGAKAGDVVVLRPRLRPCPAIVAMDSRDVCLEDVVVHDAYGMAFVAQRCENVSWRGSADAERRTSGVFPREGCVASAHADASHFSNVKGHVAVENCWFEGMMDDAINVHSTCLAVTDVASNRMIRCRYMHPQAVGFDVFLPGETLRFVCGRTLENGPELKVAAVERLSPEEVEITLDGSVPDGFGVGDAVENADWQCSVSFTGNVVRNNRARGSLFTTSGRVVVASNRFEHCTGAAVLFAGDASKWYETGACRDVAIRGNVFSNCCTAAKWHGYSRGILSFCPTVGDVGSQKEPYHRNVLVEDNVFHTFDVPLLYAFSVENLVWRNNRVFRNDDYRGWGEPPFVIDHCRNVWPAVPAVCAPESEAPEVTWSVMHPTAVDAGYMRRVVEKAEAYGGVDSFEICGLEQKGINALSAFGRYPHAAANVDRAFVEKTRRELNAACEIAHNAGKKVYFWHRENLVPKGLFEDLPGLLDEDGEFDLLGKPYEEYLRSKIDDAFGACPGLDGLVLTLTESEYSVLHNSNQVRYPAVRVVENLVGIFGEELRRRGKRFILRSFGIGEDYAKIIAGASAAARHSGAGFEIETKVTEADFVPWLPVNKYLKRSPPLSLGAECDALGEYLGAGALPAAQVSRIGEYVAAARREGVSRYAIRIDRGGASIFDTAHEVNLYAYMRFIRNPGSTEGGILSEYARKHFGAAAEEMVPVMKAEMDIVRGTCYIASNLMFHTQPTATNFRIAKAGGLFALFREGESLSNMSQIWSMFGWMRAPSHGEILAEKDHAVAEAESRLSEVGRLAPLMPPEEAARQLRAFSNAVALARAMRGFARCAVAYFEDMADRADEPKRLSAAVADARSEIARCAGDIPAGLRLDGILSYCDELLEEYRAERTMRRALEAREDVVDFVIPGGIFDDGRVGRMMHAAYSERKGDALVRHVGNARYPNGRIEVALKAPQTAKIEVDLDPCGAQLADVDSRWSNGVWTVSIGKKPGLAHPSVRSIAATAETKSAK